MPNTVQSRMNATIDDSIVTESGLQVDKFVRQT